MFAGFVECIILSPVLIWKDIKYLSNEHYCFVSFLQIRGILWMIGSTTTRT